MGSASSILANMKALGWVTGVPKVSGCAWRLVGLLGSKLLAGLRRGVRAALPSWLLWAVRLLSVRALDYQEVVWEYGVHWNFFATIALVSLACALLGPLTWRQAAGAALLLTALHQAALQWGGWGAWALSDERPAGLGPCPLLPSLLALWPFSSGNDHLQSLHGASAALVAWLRQLAGLNREGLVSLPGYIALRLVGQALGGGLRSTWAWAARRTSAAGRQLGRGRTRHPAQKTRSTADTMLGQDDGVLGQYATGIQRGEAAKPEAGVTAAATVTWGEARPALEAFVVWGVVCGALWLLLLLAEVCLQPVSRRTCNLAYVVWIAALCVTLLLPLAAAQVLLPTGLRPSLPLAVSQNMLPVFLAANLTTGAVNMGCDTMQIGPGQARAIVMAHVGLVVAIAWLLDRSDVVLKI
ncbi:GWT1-domain-containing protein [Haematococcus lacustris]